MLHWYHLRGPNIGWALPTSPLYLLIGQPSIDKTGMRRASGSSPDGARPYSWTDRSVPRVRAFGPNLAILAHMDTILDFNF